MAERDARGLTPPALPEALAERFRATVRLASAPGVERFAVRDEDAPGSPPMVLELATRATLFDDPLSAFHGAAALCFGPQTPPTPIAAAARALHRFHHPAIPRPQGVGTVDLRPWIVTRLPAGAPVVAHALPWHGAELLPLAEALFEALSHAHARGVVHRALTAHNLFWGPGGLGLVGWTSAAVDGHPPPDLAIDPALRAPESWLGAPPDARVDLYGAGALLYTLLTGRPPFSPSDPDVGWHHVHTPPPTLAPGPSPALAGLVEALLAKDPDARPASARDALAILRAAPPVARRSVTGPAFAAPPGRRKPGLALAAMGWGPGTDEGPALTAPAEPAPPTEPAPPAEPAPAPEAWPVPDDPLDAARHLLACGRPEQALRRSVDAEGARRLSVEARNALRIVAGRALLARGEAIKAFEAFDLAVHAGPGPTDEGLVEIADAAVDADRIEVAVDAAIRATLRDPVRGRPLLARVVGRTLLRRAEPPEAAQMLPLAVACTHLAFGAIEDGGPADEGATAWFQRGREVGQAGMMALTGPMAPVFPLHVALCAWGTGDPRAARGALQLAIETGLKVPRTVDHVGPEVCLRLALLFTHQRERAKSPPPPLIDWAADADVP